jgi:putative ABC transport system permease protein
MDESVIDIDWLYLSTGYLLFAIPFLAFWYYRTGLVKDTLIAIVRMSVQLFLVGLYLELLFHYDHPLINLLWVLIMMGVAGHTIVQRSGLSYRLYLLPVIIGVGVGLLVVDLYFFGVVIRLDSYLQARYFIPLTGMILGNSIRSSIIGLETYYQRLERERALYRFAIGNGASKGEALRPFMRDALRRAFNPAIATMAMVGLISLPGMMTGQILGGSDPSVAIKYQIMLMITIFVAGNITVLLAIFISDRWIFDRRGMPKGKLRR